MGTSRTVILFVLVGALALIGVPVLAAPGETDAGVNRKLAEVRRATRQYQDVEAAKDAGYHLDDRCVEGMGFHASRVVPPSDADDDVDHRNPEVLVYAPRAENGALELVAVEYLSSDEDEHLFDRAFDPAHGPVPPSLHAWVWQGNPDGVFTARNPKVSCPE